ncbi:MAG: hypothetical protein AAFU71_01690 [Cyanobacteria bacterium J06632_22]
MTFNLGRLVLKGNLDAGTLDKGTLDRPLIQRWPSGLPGHV